VSAWSDPTEDPSDLQTAGTVTFEVNHESAFYSLRKQANPVLSEGDISTAPTENALAFSPPACFNMSRITRSPFIKWYGAWLSRHQY
jgi:hypothetical protein